MRERAVLFDLDDTLVPDEPAADAALLCVAGHAKAIHNIPPESLRRSVRAVARRVWRAHPVVAAREDFEISSWEALCSSFAGEDEEMKVLCGWAPEYRRIVWNEALAENGVADPLLADQLSVLYQVERRNRYQAFDDVVPALSGLKGSFRLGVVTNGPADLQRDKVARAGIAGCFGAVVISREVGCAKPDRRIFAIAMERLGVDAAATVHVGDSLKRDVAGAKAAGIRAVWLNRGGATAPDGVKPDAEIRSLDGLAPLL